mgnify:CR=1 FL=1
MEQGREKKSEMAYNATTNIFADENQFETANGWLGIRFFYKLIWDLFK